jgi:succinoglycan biosynthesis transport protein ExoP
MNRVSDAMRRAGHQEEDDQPAAAADDMPFVSGEDAADDPVVSAVARSTTEVKYIPAPLVRRDRIIPIEVTRPDSDDDVEIFDVMRTLYRHRWLMAAVMAACVAAAVVYNHRATPIYEARARLIIEPNSPDVVPFRVTAEDQARLDYYATQIEVLRSRALARRTLELLHVLDEDPTRQSAQIARLMGGLAVAVVKGDIGETRVINITFRSSKPELAAQMANGLAQAYLAQNLEGRRQGSHDAADWLNQRLAELRREVNTREAALQQYREQKESVSLGEPQNIVVQKLLQLNTAVTSARTDKLEKQGVFEQLTAIQQSGAPLDTFSPILANPFIQGLKAELAGLRRDRERLVDQLGELHPDMIKVNNAIATAERRLNNEMAKVVEGVQNDYRAAQAKEQELTAELEDQKREVLNLNQKSIGFVALQRDVASEQQMLDTVRQRLKETELSGELQSNNARILDVAEVPHDPITPRKELNLIIALLGGSLAAAGLAFGVEYLNPRIAKADDIADALGLPLLGTAPQVAALKNRPATVDALPPYFHEAVRGIRTRIFLSPLAAAARSIAVTSTSSGEGKTVVSSSLAVSMARAGRRVLLVDADLRRPQLHRMFNIPRSPGLSEVMAGGARPTEALLESPVEGLFVLPAGANVANPTDLLDSDRLTQLIQGFSQVFDVVVLDCPPVMAVADASIIAHAASSVLFVVGSGTMSREAVQIGVDRLAAVQAQVVGVVLNKAKAEQSSDYLYPRYVTDDVA